MRNIHTPERLEGESFEAYKQRRAASKSAAQALTLGGIGAQRGVPSTREIRRHPAKFAGLRMGETVQHTNPDRNAVRAAKAASSARQYRKAVKAVRRIAKGDAL